jgi:hypothetical protein
VLWHNLCAIEVILDGRNLVPRFGGTLNRWETKFGAWVHKLGVAEFCRRMKAKGEEVTRGAIYAWVAGRAYPTHGKAKIIVEISGEPGSPCALTLDEVYAQPKAPDRVPRPPQPGVKLPVAAVDDRLRALGRRI